MRILRIMTAAFGLLVPTQTFAALSDNLIVNGDFESIDNLKNAPTLDGEGVEIPVHRWNDDTDYGMWIAKWGPPSLGGLAGFSTYDDPRDIGETGGDTQASGDLGTMNRSTDPTDGTGANHVIENLAFRPRWAQWFKAPEGHVAGPMSMSFDFYLHDWSNFDSSAPTQMLVTLYGLNFSPDHDESYVVDNVGGNPVTPLSAEPNSSQPTWNPSGLDGEALVHFRFNYWMQDWSDYFDQWNHISTEDGADPLWGANSWNILGTELTETYQNYALVVYSATYAELHPYFFIYGGKVTDTPSLLWDNFDVRVSIQLPGDFDGSGTVDTQDINPFILALTDWAGYMAAYPDVDPIEVDPNGSGTVNTEDINPFIALLTGGGQASIIPEPASLSLLALGGLAMLRRRR